MTLVLTYREAGEQGTMAFDEGLAERIRETLTDAHGVSERRMFGGLAFLLHGNMFVGVVGSTLMARVGPDNYAAALRRQHAREMDFTGRPMKGYVYVDEAGTADDAALASWVALCRAFAATLPRKPAKRKAR
jgi:TfoX/Sxy family transcriptional regulator of competence genes